MDELGFADLDFAFGRCAACGKDVLTYAGYDGSGAERRHCVHCDGLVPEPLRLAKGNELPEFGYGLLEVQECGSPNCGGGQCSRRENLQ